MTKGKVKENIGTGRRKESVASVRLRKGKGKIDVNGRKFEDYFTDELQRRAILLPLTKIEAEKKYDLIVRVKGGGVHAQGDSMRLGISRALVQENEELRPQFKDAGLLTRDPRKKERKKYGLAGARKRFQFSKR